MDDERKKGSKNQSPAATVRGGPNTHPAMAKKRAPPDAHDLLSQYAEMRAEFDRERDCLAVENFNDAARMQSFISWTLPRLLGLHDEIVKRCRNIETAIRRLDDATEEAEIYGDDYRMNADRARAERRAARDSLDALLAPPSKGPSEASAPAGPTDPRCR